MTRLSAVLVATVLVACTSARTGGASGPAPEGSSSAASKGAAAVPRGGDPSRNSNGTPKDFGPLPAGVPERAVVLRYEDFGPQVLAQGLLGADCYVFGACCCSEPDDRFDVRVVVYVGPEQGLRDTYPSGPTRGDYRLVTRKAALDHLDAALRDLDEPGQDEVLKKLAARLRATRAALVTALP